MTVPISQKLQSKGWLKKKEGTDHCKCQIFSCPFCKYTITYKLKCIWGGEVYWQGKGNGICNRILEDSALHLKQEIGAQRSEGTVQGLPAGKWQSDLSGHKASAHPSMQSWPFTCTKGIKTWTMLLPYRASTSPSEPQTWKQLGKPHTDTRTYYVFSRWVWCLECPQSLTGDLNVNRSICLIN